MSNARFGVFEFNPATGELFRDGRAVRLQAQPAKVLTLLIAARGEVVTREALQQALWPDGITVDFDRGLNFAMAQVRTALGDSAESPVYVRTVPKRGYQFVAPLAEPAPAGPVATEATRPRRRGVYLALAAGAAVAALTIAGGWNRRPAEVRIAVARFENETGNPGLDRFSGTITDSFVAGLTAQTAGRYGVIGNAAILRRSRLFQDLDEIGASLQAQYVIVGQVQQDGARQRVLAHLIRMPAKTHVKVSRRYVDPAVTESQLADQLVGDLIKHLDSPAPASD